MCIRDSPSPLRVARVAREVQTLKSCDPRHGPALGLFEESVYPVGRCPLAVNDLLILFTDGLYEVVAPDGQEYGQERLLKAIQERAQLPVDKLFDGLLEEIQ